MSNHPPSLGSSSPEPDRPGPPSVDHSDRRGRQSILRSIPNILTAVRILLLPLLVWLVLRAEDLGAGTARRAAFATLAVVAGSDILDGWLARRHHWTSHLGTVLDPVADKMAQVTGLILLTWWAEPVFTAVPVFVLPLILARDLVILGGVLILGRRGSLQIRPSLWGKGATLVIFALLLLSLLGVATVLVQATAWLAGVLVVGSALGYVRDGVRLARSG